MHIVIDAHLAVRKIDGIARYLMGLLAALPALDESVRYTFLDLPREKSCLPDAVFAPDNVQRVDLDLMGPSPWQHLLMHGLLRGLEADLYHHPQYDLPLWPGVPSVITVHDLKYIFQPEFLSGKSRLKRFYIRRSLISSVRRCRRVIAVSGSTRRDLAELLPEAANKIDVIHHGVAQFGKVPPLNGSFGAALPARFILMVGTRRPHKNIEGMVRALAILRREKQVEVDLVVAGKGYADYDTPQRIAAELGLAEHVHFLGFVAEEHLPALYAAAVMVAMPSLYEGFGLPVLEALAQGLPVLGSNVTSIPEVLGDAGVLIDPRDPEEMAAKAAEILTDERLARELSARARSRAQAFTWTAVAEKTLAVYIEAAAA